MRCFCLVVILSLGACRSPRSVPTSVTPFDWLLGHWTGIRVDEASGSREALTMDVRSILGGTGQLEELEVVHDQGTYRGLHLRLHEAERDLWVSYYANDARGRCVPLELQLVLGKQSVWHSAAGDRTRESKLTYELLEAERCRRTQEVSEDGGRTWHLIFVDELRRIR
jgi:hypothetical protein